MPDFRAHRRHEPLYDLTVGAMSAWVAVRFRLQVSGIGHVPGAGPVIFAPNHVSNEDPVVIGAVARRARRRLRAVALEGLFTRPLLGSVLRATRQIPIDRERARPALEAARSALAAGEALLLYPEGTVARGRPTRARAGVGILALETGAPVVPVTSAGVEPRGQGSRWRRPAGVVVGPPVDLSPWAGDRGRSAAREVAEAVHEAIRAQLPAARGLAAAAS
ncbi:MAG: lysophospholipid acyltransferase family protein [Actinomycetota bacterium]